MWQYVTRRLLYNVPVYLGIILVVMAALRVTDPVWIHLGKNATQEAHDEWAREKGLADSFPVQYGRFVWRIAKLDFTEQSWETHTSVGEMLGHALWPTLSITVPALVLTTIFSVAIGLIAAFHRGKWLDHGLMAASVVGMSVSFLVYILLGQFFGSFKPAFELGLDIFAVQGYEPTGTGWWFYYCLLPVLISTIVALGYDTRFYRTVMVEESTRDYIRTARAKGISETRVMFVHMLKNAAIPIITRVMITFPFLIMGSILLESFFNIPGMGLTLITALNGKDFPVIQAFTAVFAALFIVSNILTDVLYALVDPRVRLS